MTRVSLVLLGLTLLTVLGLANLAPAESSDAVARGKKIFNDTGDDFEWPSCAHCHAIVSAKEEAEKTGHVKPAYPVLNTSNRGAWKNKAKGTLKTAGDAGNICVRAFQKRKKLPAEQVSDLNAYLASVSPSKDVKPRKIKYAPKVLEDFSGGNAEEGKKKVQLYCAGCHGSGDNSVIWELKKGRKKRLRVAQKVRGYTRKGEFKANNGMMSFFAIERLPDKDLKDIIAYVGK
ncbi:MAG: cytochrome c [Planctomycetota bacterium]|nr:cytochrome c [Planctomycetota bacterium]